MPSARGSIAAAPSPRRASGRSTRSTARRAFCAASSTPSRWRSSRTAGGVGVLGCPNLPLRARARPVASWSPSAVPVQWAAPARRRATARRAIGASTFPPPRRCRFCESGHDHSSTRCGELAEHLGVRVPRCAWTASASTPWSRAVSAVRLSTAADSADYGSSIWDHAAALDRASRRPAARSPTSTARTLDFSRGRTLDRQPRRGRVERRAARRALAALTRVGA